MSKMIKSKFYAITAVAASALAFGATAQADTLVVREVGTSAPVVISSAETEGIGLHALTNSGNPVSALNGSFLAFCVEPFQKVSDAAHSVGDSSYSAAFTAAPSAPVQRLFDLYYGSATTTDSLAAPFALALQELVTETSGSYSLSSGTFTRVGFGTDGQQAVAAANTLLTSVLSAPDASTHLKLVEFKSGTSQDFLAATAPVPEPETYALLLAGLGAVGFAVRRRRR